MTPDARYVRLVGYMLSLLYGISFVYFWIFSNITVLRRHAVVTAILFLSLFLCSFIAAQLKEWARRLVVLINLFVLFYFLSLAIYYPGLIHPAYIFLSFLVVLYFNLPAAKIPFQPNWPFARRSILVIDDDEGLLKTIQKILLPNGYSVLVTTTGEKGIQIARLQKPDLILLDVILPGIKGREVCAQLKESEQTRNIPVVFLTAKDSPDDIQAEREAGGSSHITKPVDAKTLLAEIRKVLG